MIQTLEKITELVAKNIKFIGVVGAVAFIAGAVVTGLYMKKQKDESVAFGQLSSLEKTWGEWKSQSTRPAAAEQNKDEKTVDAEALFKDLMTFAEKNRSLKAGKLAALMMSDVGHSLKKDEQLLQFYETHFKKQGDELLMALSALKKGDLEANSGKCDLAIKTWEPLHSKKRLGYLADLAHLKTGLCYEKLNQNDQALRHYEAILTTKDAKADRWAFKEAQKFKRALQWSQN